MLQEMGLNRDACTEYLANNGASLSEGDAFISRLSPHYLHHHVQSSKASAALCSLHVFLRYNLLGWSPDR